MDCLVTGGAGFIGSHLTEALLSAGHRVRVLDDLSSGAMKNLRGVEGHGALSFIEGDVRDMTCVDQAVDGVDAVFHLAALVSVPLSVEAPVRCHAVNGTGTVHVLDAAMRHKVGRVLFTSSAAVYGDVQSLPVAEDCPPSPLSPYALDKWYGEEAARLMQRSSEAAVTVFRLFNVYGSRQDPHSPYSGVISVFMNALENGKAPVIFGDGEQTRDFVHVSDVVQGFLLALDQRATGFECFNLAGGSRTSIAELWNTAAGLKGLSIPPRFEAARGGDILHSCADISRIREALGYQQKVGLAKGLAMMAGM